MNRLIGKKIQELRKQKGFSQEQVAERLHISQSAYARMEKGGSHSWANHCLQLCKIFKIAPEELISRELFVVGYGQEVRSVYQVNKLSGKLIKQYEDRLKEKDEIIRELKNTITEINKK